MDGRQELLRKIPSVEKVLEHLEIIELARGLPRWTVTESAREVLAEIRKAISDGRRTEEPGMAEIIDRLSERARRRSRRGIRKVINATGVVIHTNLGRSLLSEEALSAVEEVAGSYCCLEFDLSTGRRTSRTKDVESLLSKILACEGAFVVNNNAGAVLLALNTLSNGKETIVSRGELIEIGGSFRLPEVMDKSGARMVEVGTTNRTRIRDYEDAISESTRVILKVHHSNFEMTGFVESVSTRDLAQLAHRYGLIVMEDLGSGALVDLSQLGMVKEPMPQESLRDGVDIVTFSGDKVLGGPQAGVIVGKGRLVDEMKSNPLARALRVDKMTLAALEVTLRHYLEPELVSESVPTLRTISCAPKQLESRARTSAKILTEKLGEVMDISVTKEVSQVGGGSLPTAGLETFVMAIKSDKHSADEIVTILRNCEVPIIARIVEDRVLIDFRTVQPSEDETLTQELLAAFAGGDRHVERS